MHYSGKFQNYKQFIMGKLPLKPPSFILSVSLRSSGRDKEEEFALFGREALLQAWAGIST